MCVLVCVGAGTRYEPHVWAEMGSWHTPHAGHGGSPAGSVPTHAKPCVPTHVPSAFLTMHNQRTDNHVVHVADGVGVPLHTHASLVATVPLCMFIYLCCACPSAFAVHIHLPLPCMSIYLCHARPSIFAMHIHLPLPYTSIYAMHVHLPVPCTSIYLCAGASTCVLDLACPRLREHGSSPF